MNKSSEVLKNYKHLNPGVQANLFRIMNHGKLKGTGKFVIYPVDQGFEHGPARSFSSNSSGYDPLYHIDLALEAGVNAYAAPLGFIQMAAAEYPGHIPLILKLNNNDALFSSKNPVPAMTSTVQDALELGCNAIGFTIYPGTSGKNNLFNQLREFIRMAHDVGLVAVVWSYPRGEAISKQGEASLDIVAYASQIASQMGADMIKVKLPVETTIGLKANLDAYNGFPMDSLEEKVRHIIQSGFDGKRITIFSGGATKSLEELLNEVQAVKNGGGFGSIVGRNVFQRPKEEALNLLDKIMDIYHR